MEMENDTKDINEVFEDILFTEDTIVKEGFQEGFQVGSSQANVEGYHLGYHRGAELGAEIGYYSAFTKNYLESYTVKETFPEKVLKILHTLEALLSNFPRHNVENVDFIELIDNIRAKFKKLCAILKLDATFPEIDNLSF